MKRLLWITVLMAATQLGIAQAPYTSSLKVHYSCKGNLNDVSGNVQNGTVTGATLAADKAGIASYAYSFDGVDDFATVPATGPYVNFTLLARVKFTSTATLNLFSGTGAAVNAGVSAGKVAWHDGTAWRYSTTLVNNNQWHDVAYVFNNTTYSIYVDGTIEYTGLGSASVADGTVSLIAKNVSNSAYFAGTIDEVKIYNGSLAASQIAGAFNGYAVTWVQTQGLTINGDNTTTKTGSNGWDAGAISQNMIVPGQDGYIQFSYSGSTSQIYMIGLSHLNNDHAYQRNDYCVYITGNVMYSYALGANINHGGIVSGDQFRVAREGNAINYYKNNVIFRTAALTSNAHSLFGDLNLGGVGAPAAIISMEPPLEVKPSFTFPSLANNDGSISLAVAGGVSPVTYAWSSGETSSTITGKPRGAYTATVTDGMGRVSVHTYSLGYPIAWKNPVNVNVNADNTLTKTDYLGWTSGASSLNMIPANTDGWLEFVVNDANSSFMIGLSRLDKGASYNHEYTWSLTYDNTYIFEANINIGVFASLQRGDVFRIERVGASIRYLVNGVVKRTVSGSASHCYLVDVSISANMGPLPAITTSADRKLQFIPTLIFPTAANNDGSVSLNVSGFHSPLGISWSSGETTTLLSNKARGTYTATLTDAAGQNVSRSYRLGYPVIWTDLVYMTYNQSANTLFRNPPAGYYDAGAISANILPPTTNGWIEFDAPISTSLVMIGLARQNSNPYFSSIDYAFFFNQNDLLIYELGTNLNIIRNVVEGDRYTIERVGSNIIYSINGVAVRTIATNSTYQLVADVSAYNGTIPPISASFTKTPQTYYSIASGNWNNPAIWSLAENGAPATSYPSNFDNVIIKGYTVSISSNIYCSSMNIDVTNATTGLKVDGSNGALTVKGNIVIKGVGNTETGTALLVQNDGRITIQN